MYTKKKKDLKTKKYKSISIPIIIGIVLGLAAKLVDVPAITGVLPIFDEIFGRFGVWIFTATLLAVFSFTPTHAAMRVFSFFISMLLTYYVYTIAFLGFYPKSQIILWGIVSLVSPICGTVMWYAHDNKWTANILASLPITALCTEWYITGRENILLFVVYLCLVLFLLRYVPKKARQCLPVILIAAVMTLLLIKIGLMDFIYGSLLNV